MYMKPMFHPEKENASCEFCGVIIARIIEKDGKVKWDKLTNLNKEDE